MKTKLKLYVALVSFVLCTLPAIAHAHVTRVWYDWKNEPIGFNRALLLRTIQSAMREWEYHGRGQIAMKWEGITYDKPGGGGDDMIFGWDPALVGSTTYAQTWVYTFAQVAPMGRINLNPAMMAAEWVYTGPPVLNNSGVVARAALIHEMAHWFRFDAGHPPNSVLQSTCPGGLCTDFIALALFNDDMDGINQNIYFPLFAPTYPPLGVLLLTDIYNASNGTVVSGGGTGLSGATELSPPGAQNFTGALGVGGPGYSYARAYTDWGLITIDQGTGTVPWTNKRTINDFTRRQMCITGTSTTSDMYVVWTANPMNVPAAVTTTGARAVRWSESHDGGNTWSVPGNIGGAQTRTGVSCGFDVGRNRVVVAWADPTTFAIDYTERTPSSVGATWAPPNTIPGPTTYELPIISFDPFTQGSGVLTWHAIYHAGSPKISRLSYNGTSYVASIVDNAVYPGEEGELRTNAVPNPFGSEMHYAYGRNAGPPSTQVRIRRGNNFSTLSWDSYAEGGSGDPPFDRYVGSANDRIYWSSAYLRHSISPH